MGQLFKQILQAWTFSPVEEYAQWHMVQYGWKTLVRSLQPQRPTINLHRVKIAPTLAPRATRATRSMINHQDRIAKTGAGCD